MDDEYGPRGRGNGGDWGGVDGPWSGMHDGMGWGGWLFMVLLALLLTALVVGIVITLVRTTSNRPAADATGAPGPATAAGSVLDERYARGEIDEDEYLHRRAVLRGS